MSRRRPVPRVAVVPRAAGQDHDAAVLDKAARAASAALGAQELAASALASPFAAAYVAGYARQQSLRNGVDPESRSHGMADLVACLSGLSPAPVASGLQALRFEKREGDGPHRALLRAVGAEADAGYLVGHLESLCGTRMLLAAALSPRPESASAYLTLCDLAADRLQTHQPTASLRFESGERAVLRAAFGA